MSKGKEVTFLRDQQGVEFTLFDEKDQEHKFQLLLELVVDHQHFAFFKQDKELNDELEEDIEVLKVVKGDNDEYDLEYIENDDEWEDAAELYDEWTYNTD